MAFFRVISAALAISQIAATVLDPANFAPNDVIARDVCVIGGGSTGTYTSIRLRDYNKSVVVVEEKARLGGHAETYIDPATGTSFNLGVVVFAQISEVKNYFARFKVPLMTYAQSSSNPEYVDFGTGNPVNFTPPSQQAFGAALSAYGIQLAKYPDLQAGFNLTYPVPEDLLLPFGDFIEKYSLGALLPTVFTVCQGYSPLLKLSTLYMFKYLNSDLLNSFSTGFLTTVHHNTGELYDKAAIELGQDVLFNSSVLAMDRSSSSGPVKVLVKTPSGHKLIIAKKLVSTIPPKVNNLQGFDLSSGEKSLFSQFFDNAYYTGILQNTGLPRISDLNSPGPMLPSEPASYSSGQSKPHLPGIYGMSGNNATDLFQVFYGVPRNISDDEVKADIITSVQRIQAVRGIPRTTPKFVAFSNHAPFNLMVSTEAIKDRFYEKLYALQGQRNTFYNGAAFQSQDSSVLWRFTEGLLPAILAAL